MPSAPYYSRLSYRAPVLHRDAVETILGLQCHESKARINQYYHVIGVERLRVGRFELDSVWHRESIRDRLLIDARSRCTCGSCKCTAGYRKMASESSRHLILILYPAKEGDGAKGREAPKEDQDRKEKPHLGTEKAGASKSAVPFVPRCPRDVLVSKLVLAPRDSTLTG